MITLMLLTACQPDTTTETIDAPTLESTMITGEEPVVVDVGMAWQVKICDTRTPQLCIDATADYYTTGGTLTITPPDYAVVIVSSWH